MRVGGSFRLSPRVSTCLAARRTSRRTMRSRGHCIPSTLHEHSRLGRSRFGQHPCECRQIEGPGVSRRRQPASVGSRFFSRAIERFLLDRTPLSRTSDAPVALVDQTSGALTTRACLPTPKIDSPHNLVKSYRTHDPRRLLPFEGLLRSVCSSLPNTQTTKQTGLAFIGFATDTTRTSDAPPTLSRC